MLGSGGQWVDSGSPDNRQGQQGRSEVVQPAPLTLAASSSPAACRMKPLLPPAPCLLTTRAPTHLGATVRSPRRLNCLTLTIRLIQHFDSSAHGLVGASS
jgi:hypothetical protein